MALPLKETIPNLLRRDIPRQLLLAVEEAFIVGAERAFAAARGMDDGHLPHVVGHMRHFHMNETFHQALAVNGAAPTAIRGSSIVTGRTGVFTLGRFNAKDDLWNNARRSQRRKELALANAAIEPLVQPELFGAYVPPTEGAVFFVACFAGSLRIQPERPVTIQVAVPDRSMRHWLYRDSLEAFIRSYDEVVAEQYDLAQPKLRKDIGKKIKKDGTGDES